MQSKFLRPKVMNFRTLVLRPPYTRHRSLRSQISRPLWDPALSLKHNHQALVLLEKCRSWNHFREILGQIMRVGLIGETFPMSRLITFSATSHPENLDTAILLFDHFTFRPNLYIYNTMISALCFSKARSFSLYNTMLCSGVYPDKHTLMYLLKVARFVPEVKLIHCHAIVTGFFSYGYLRNSLMKMYLEKGSMRFARQVFGVMSERDVVSYNIMIVGNAKGGFCLEAIELFREMSSLGLEPDEFTMLGLLLCSGALRDSWLGKAVHAWTERRKFRSSSSSSSSSKLVLCNALLDMFLKCNEFDHALKVFDSLPEKDSFSWNTMISGYVKAGELDLALSFFKKIPMKDLVSWNSLIAGFSQSGDYNMVIKLFNTMIAKKVRPDKVTMICLVSSAAETGVLDHGVRIHGVAIRMIFKVDAFLGSALIDMYCKCGSVERAFLVFKGLRDKDVTVWTSLITGFAFHGYGDKALELFYEMQRIVRPNGVTLVSVLTACTHSGLVDEGRDIFYNMEEKFGIRPGIEHYGCLVDLLGRSGRLLEAKAVIKKMPMRPSRSIWGAMLSACRVFKNVKLAEMASTELLKLEPEKEGGYVLLSNLYAVSGKWKDSDMIREAMVKRGVKKGAGCSSVIVNGHVHSFVATDSQHPRWPEIESILQSLNSERSSL